MAGFVGDFIRPLGPCNLYITGAAAVAAILFVVSRVKLDARQKWNLDKLVPQQAFAFTAFLLLSVSFWVVLDAVAVADGGLELVEAGTRYGDDVMRVAVEAGPAARRALALDAGNLVPLVRELGPEALELEAQSPGLARRAFTAFGSDGARQIARTVPPDDLPRLVAYAERADTPATRKALLEAYEKEGSTIFNRIPPKLVLAGGLTVAMVYGTHRATAPMAAVGHRIGNDPALARRAVDWLAIVGGGLAMLVTGACLWRFGLLRGPRPRPERPVADTPFRNAQETKYDATLAS